MLTLLWGLPAEEPMQAVWTALGKLGTPRFFLDQRRVLATSMRDWRLRVGRRSIGLDDVGGCYLRPYDTRLMPAVVGCAEGSHEPLRALEFDDRMLGWLETTPATVVNRPSAMLPNSSKPYQLLQIEASGFAVPATLLTTDSGAAAAFWERHREVVYKSMSGVRSRVSRLTPAHTARLGDLAHCPTLFQAYVAGADFRCHVVGGEVYAARVMSEADDYRYPGPLGPPEVQPERLPPDIEERCRRTAAQMGLLFAGLDLRRTPAGEWYCFEVNPSPAFTYYEGATGQPLAAALARLLATGPGNAVQVGSDVWTMAGTFRKEQTG